MNYNDLAANDKAPVGVFGFGGDQTKPVLLAEVRHIDLGHRIVGQQCNNRTGLFSQGLSQAQGGYRAPVAARVDQQGRRLGRGHRGYGRSQKCLFSTECLVNAVESAQMQAG